MTLPIIVVPDEQYEAVRSMLGIAPSPLALHVERRKVNQPVTHDRRMPAEFEPVEE